MRRIKNKILRLFLSLLVNLVVVLYPKQTRKKLLELGDNNINSDNKTAPFSDPHFDFTVFTTAQQFPPSLLQC